MFGGGGIVPDVLVAQDKMRVEQFIRQWNREWLLRVFTQPQERVELNSIDSTLTLEEIYQEVDFTE